MEERAYIAIDLKSFFASVECVDRGLDPLQTNLVVADRSRTEKTICLAVSPSLKAYGIPGRARLFEVVERVREVNAQRRRFAPGRTFTGSSCNAVELRKTPALALDYIIAQPQMARYMQLSTQIYQIYLKYIAPEDMHVYSIDEVFIDVTRYLQSCGMSARELAMTMILDVLHTTGITATAGIGTNLYLCKIAMDIGAKHIEPDENGVRIAELNEESYRRTLWTHRPLTDFWRVGAGYARRLESNGLYTMGDIARCSLGKPGERRNEQLLYRLFGVNAELLIDHAWGWEPCTIADIKAYKPSSSSTGSGQVLQTPYPADKAKLVMREMADLLALDLVDRGLTADQVVLTIGYDTQSLEDGDAYSGSVSVDRYGRTVPKSVHGSADLGGYTASARRIVAAAEEIFDRIVDSGLLVRRMYVVANHLCRETEIPRQIDGQQLDFFTDYAAEEERHAAEEASLERERRMQQALLSIKRRYGKNAILKGMNFEEGATARERNRQIGGHKA